MTHEDAHEVPRDDVAEDLAVLVKAPRVLIPGPRCGTAAALEQIAAEHPDLAADLLAAVDNPDVHQGKTAEFLTRHSGRTLKAAQVGYHRRRGTSYGCSCPKEGS